LHDGSVKELDKVVQLMAKAQLSKELTPEQTSDITAFLKTLTGEVPADAKVVPVMP
jgi:cytochrome c peroxidase